MRRPEGTAQQVGAGEEADGAVQGLGLLDLTVFLGLGDVNIWWLYCIYIYHMYIYSIYIYICVCACFSIYTERISKKICKRI